MNILHRYSQTTLPHTMTYNKTFILNSSIFLLSCLPGNNIYIHNTKLNKRPITNYANLVQREGNVQNLVVSPSSERGQIHCNPALTIRLMPTIQFDWKVHLPCPSQHSYLHPQLASSISYLAPISSFDLQPQSLIPFTRQYYPLSSAHDHTKKQFDIVD